MNNSFFSKFGPKEPKFFDYLKQVSEILLAASEMLQGALECQTGEERKEFFRKIKEKERLGDELSHKIFEELSSSFITPFDREDIHLLADKLDDVIDRINSCAKRIAIYNPRPIGDSGKELSLLVQKEADYICKAMDELDTFRKNPATLREYCSKLHDIENQADDVYELFITKLFEEEKDCIEIIKIKEIMQILEKTTDSAEYVGKILRTLIVKYA
jgi:predicted phosphate transport protein (TIGR00153 family)